MYLNTTLKYFTPSLDSNNQFLDNTYFKQNPTNENSIEKKLKEINKWKILIN